MTDKPQPDASTLAWHPIPINCPRCNQPMRARCTPSVSRVTTVKCIRACWTLDVDLVRKILKDTLTPIDDEEPTTDEEPIE